MGATLVLSLIVQESIFAEGVARLLARVAATLKSAGGPAPHQRRS